MKKGNYYSIWRRVLPNLMIYASVYIYYLMTRNGQNVITKSSMRK